MLFFRKLVKGVALYLAILAVVTVGAAIIGCAFLPNGNIDYLLDPPALFTFLWTTRAGLKVTILFVTTMIFLLFAEGGALSRDWVQRSRRNNLPGKAKEAWVPQAIVELKNGQRFHY
jgi:hypothetical protein